MMLSMFGIIIGMNCCHTSYTLTELASTSRPVTPHFVSWWEKNALYHRTFPLHNFAQTGNRTLHHIRSLLGCGMPWRLPITNHVRETAARRKRLYDTKAVNRKFPIGSWVLWYYPPAAQHKLGSPWIGPNQVFRQATGHTVGIQRDPHKPIVFVHVDDLKLRPAPEDVKWSPDISTAKSLCASTVDFRPGSQVSDVSAPSVDVSGWEDVASHHFRIKQPLVN